MAVCPGSWHAVWVMCICTPRPAMGHPAHPAHRDLDGARALSATILSRVFVATRRQTPGPGRPDVPDEPPARSYALRCRRKLTHNYRGQYFLHTSQTVRSPCHRFTDNNNIPKAHVKPGEPQLVGHSFLATSWMSFRTSGFCTPFSPHPPFSSLPSSVSLDWSTSSRGAS